MMFYMWHFNPKPVQHRIQNIHNSSPRIHNT